jgi:glutathione S-transferase
MSDVTLVTFPPSLDSELARFLLRHYGISHTEERHTLVFSSLATLKEGTILFPVAYGDSYRLSTVRKMVDHFDPLAAEERQLFPTGAHRGEVEKDWDLFHEPLAYGTATFAYYHLLPHREIMVGPLSAGAPAAEVSAVKAAYPLFAGLLRLLLRLTGGRAARALDDVRRIVDGVDARLADGRRYLVADRFSLSDMAFAVAMAPLVLPDEYGGALPSRAEMPPPIAAAITEMRARPAGDFVLRIYREKRAGAA